MEKFKLNLEYKVGKAVFSTNLLKPNISKLLIKQPKAIFHLKWQLLSHWKF